MLVLSLHGIFQYLINSHVDASELFRHADSEMEEESLNYFYENSMNRHSEVIMKLGGSSLANINP